ncbi:2-hydroxychromene-2-carboxylate isomerase [Sedimentitalea sp. CY04]|uniref:2-hydroxychromene-2-carboxylate isomerase n=1 Tax=Parasedimentitalea denitrificans TaxID=2211118 RepID=A0ABX0W2K6_9RHOB|nr:2-hydroxychromene-2-carboxylate isomerase [Sedimentitalea sp. CY04]NIZ59867.1 2-hydroxychromene-2-carboxylate isomerase [Sedimentitalea sp. CY04]
MLKIDFWYSIGSTYSYLSVMRLSTVAQSSGVRFRWRPFNVRHVMVEQKNIPFKDKPVKSAYMWRDIQRRAQKYSLQPTLPAAYPLAGLVLANLVATLGAEEGWAEAYTRATYQRWFESKQPAGEEPNLSASLADIGQNPTRVLEEAQSSRISDALSSATEKAMEIGVFGSPTFAVGDEIFWGDDRLEDAVDWARQGRLG